VEVVDDAIQAHNFARHLETRNLVSAIFCRHAGFEKTGAYRIQGAELFAIAKKSLIAFDFATRTDQVINALKLWFAQPHGHAQFAHIAVAAGNFDSVWCHGSCPLKI
jgi:hypothetical protein